MILLVAWPPIIPSLMIFPVLLALFFDNNKDSETSSFIKKFVGGFLTGAIIHIGVYILFNSYFEEGSWGWYQIFGLILPVLFGFWQIYSKTIEQIKSRTLSVKSTIAGLIYVVFVAPYLLVFPLFDEQMVAIILILPGLVGLWFASMFSTHTKKYFAIYISLALLSLLLFGFTVAVLSIM